MVFAFLCKWQRPMKAEKRLTEPCCWNFTFSTENQIYSSSQWDPRTITTNIIVFHFLSEYMLKLQNFTFYLQKAADPLGKHFTILQAHSGYWREMKQCRNTLLAQRVTLHELFKSGGNPGTITGMHRHYFVKTGSDSDCCQQRLFVWYFDRWPLPFTCV